MTERQDPSAWTQPALLPVYWPLIIVRQTWAIPADGTSTMISYDVHGESSTHQLLAKGIEWCSRIHDQPERQEVFHDIIRVGLEHLSPF